MSRPDSTALLARAVMLLGRRLRAERPRSGVSLSGLSLLVTLHRMGAMPAASLARMEGLQPQSLSRLIAALEQDGLIRRHASEADRRLLVLEITERGRGELARDVAARQRWLAATIAERLTPDEAELLARAAPLLLRLAGAPSDEA